MKNKKLSNEKEQHINNSYESTLTENEFVSLLLSYLRQKGIRTITEEELSKKLFPYYLNEKYRILFTDIAKARDGDKVDIGDGMYSEKYFSDNIMWTIDNPTTLYLLYRSDYNILEYEKIFRPEIVRLLDEVADEFGVRNKVESSRFNIYGYDPNKNYSIFEAKNSVIYGLELITDGDIQTMSDSKIEPHILYADPSGFSEYRTYKEGILRDVTIENASYAITQGTHKGEIKKVEVFTKIVELEKLKKIREIASVIHNDEDSLLINDRPYVRKKTLW